MKKIEVKIKGIMPLLQHKMSLDVETQLSSKSKKQPGASKELKVEDCLYKVGEKICQPASHIEMAILKQASNYKIVGRGKKTYKDLVKGAVFVYPDMIPHLIQDWTEDRRTVVIPSTKGRSVRSRPMLKDWELEFEIHVMNDDIPTDVLKGMLDDAGREGGLGDYRPRFGRFVVEKFEEIE